MQIDNLLLSQVGSVPDVPVTTESPVSTDREGGIFSTLLLLALIGNSGAGTGTPFLNPSPQGDEKGGDAPENSSDMSGRPQLLNDVSIPDARFHQITPADVVSLAKTYSDPSLHLDEEGQLQRSPDAVESEIQVSVNQEKGPIPAQHGLDKPGDSTAALLGSSMPQPVQIPEDGSILNETMNQGSQGGMKIPLNPPFSKGEFNSPPLEKGGKGGFEKGFPDETFMLHGNTKDNENPPPLNPLPQGKGRSGGIAMFPPPLMGGGERVGGNGEGEGFSGERFHRMALAEVVNPTEASSRIEGKGEGGNFIENAGFEPDTKHVVSKSQPLANLPGTIMADDDLLTLQRFPIAGDKEIQILPDQEKGPILMQHGLDKNISPLSEELKPIAGSFKEGDKQDNFNNNTNNKEDRGWIGENDIGTFAMKDPLYMDTDSKVQPFHKSIDQEKILQQLSQRLIHAPHPGTHTARIRLKPEELGELCLDISVIDNKVRAVISVDNYDVKEIIEGNINRLEEELKNHGLRIEQFTVEMNGGGPGDDFMSSTYRGETFNKRGFSRVSEDNRVNQEGLDPVTMDAGVISIFA